MQIFNHIITETEIGEIMIITNIFLVYLSDRVILGKVKEELKKIKESITPNQDIKDEIEKLKLDILNLINKNTVNDADIKQRLHKLEQQRNPSKRKRYEK